MYTYIHISTIAWELKAKSFAWIPLSWVLFYNHFSFPLPSHLLPDSFIYFFFCAFENSSTILITCIVV